MQYSKDTGQNTTYVVKNSAVITVLKALSFGGALLIDIAVAMFFGLSQETDAFFIAFTVPQLVSSILLVAFNVALVPIFVEDSERNGQESLWRTVSNLANLSLLGFCVLGILGSLSSPLLIRAIGVGLELETQALAISLSKLVFLMIIPLATVEVFTAALNSLQSFAYPASTTLIRNVTTFIVVFFFGKSHGIQALAFGYVISGWLQLIFLAGALFRKGFRYQLTIHRHDPKITNALRQIRHPVAGSILNQSIILIERFLASFLPAGIVTALVYARRLLRGVDGIFLGSISTVMLPQMSKQFVLKNMRNFIGSLTLGLKLSMFVSIPLTVGIISQSELIVSVLFQRGEFDSTATDMVSRFLSLYILSIPPMACLQFLIVSYYATMDTKTPFLIKAAMLSLNVVLAIILFFFLGAEGLALALGLTRAFGATYIVWALYKRFGSWQRSIFTFVAKISLASLLMGGGMLGLQYRLFNWNWEGSLGLTVQVIVNTSVGAGIFVLFLMIFRVKEAEQILLLTKNYFKIKRLGKPK